MMTVLGFRDRSYTVMLGAKHKPPLVEIGFVGWRPNFIDSPRLRRIR